MNPKKRAQQISDSFPQRLKAIRKTVGMTQEQLAELAGCSTVALSKFESGVNRPSFEIFVALSLALGISADELLGLSNASDSDSPKYSVARAKLDVALKDLSTDWIEAITEIALKAKQ